MSAVVPPFSLAQAQQRLRELAAQSAAGTVDAAAHAAERREIERSLGDWLLGAPSFPADAPAGAAARRVRPSRPLVAGLSIAVLAIAVAGYTWKGSPAPAGPSGPSGTASVAERPLGPDAAASGTEVGIAQIAAMVDSLAQRMQARPDDAEGWLMLARSYIVLGRFGDAVPAFKRTLALQAPNAALLADYADALVAANGGVPTAESDATLAQALALDPRQLKALALAGTAAFDRDDFATAVARWQRMVEALPPGSELAGQVQASIAEAQRRAAGGAPAPPSTGLAFAPAPAATATATAPSAAPRSAAATVAGKTVSGTVTLAPALAARAAPGDSVFVFARPATGARMPLAVLRATVAELPLRFKLDDSMAMAPGATLSAATSVVVGARISKSGQALPQPGDLQGESAPVAPGASGLALRIGEVVGPR